MFRNEAFRKYLGLPERLGLYVPNGDGTYRYNKKVVDALKNKFVDKSPYPREPNVPQYLGVGGESIGTVDFLTGNGGNVLMDFIKRKDGKVYWDMKDVWDLHPFKGTKYETNPIANYINNTVRGTADNIYTRLYDKVYRYKIPYNYLGGSKLNKLRYGFNIEDNKKIKKVMDKIGNYEVGPILGGKPFTMRTPMEIDMLSPNIDYSDFTYQDFIKSINYKNGGTIHIAPSKRGTFTAAATRHGMGVQEFANTVLKNKDKYSPSLVKKANFARNASKWNH